MQLDFQTPNGRALSLPIKKSPRGKSPRGKSPRGYALLLVMVGGIILAALSVTLLRSATGDRSATRIQMRTVKALYASEAAVSTGVERVRMLLDTNTEPDLTTVAPPPLYGVTYDRFEVNYVDPNNNYEPARACTDDSQCTGSLAGTCSLGRCRFSFAVTLSEGAFAGLNAMQTPIQVLATADVSGAKATVADIVQLNLIPIFQFAIFFDGDLIFQKPAAMTIAGPTHTNGGLYLRGSSSAVTFESPITVAGYQQVCMLAASGDCMDSDGDVKVLGEAVTEGRWSFATDALHKASLETNHPVGIKDQTRDVQALSLPINVPSTWNVQVTSRPDTCVSNPYLAAQQNAAVALVKRPAAASLSEYTTPYSSQAANGWETAYGPVPSTDNLQTNIHASVTGLSDCSAGAAANAGAHCQRSVRSVPRMTMSQAQDDSDVKNERLYWKAHLRIIDGIWYNNAGNVIFDPEDWAITGATNTSDATFLRGLKYARVLRYSWFWDPRGYRVYGSGSRYQRGEQIRTTDFDLYAFRRLLQDNVAVNEIFGTGGVPAGGIILYLSETWDPSHTDATATDSSNGWLSRASNVRNFLDFHTMENNAANAASCFESGQMVTPARHTGKSPCALGWHPYFIWGDGAASLTSDADLASLTPPVAEPNRLAIADLRADAGYACRVPIGDNGRAELPDYTTSPKAPCIEAGASPAGAENAVRLVRGTRMPEDASNNPVGFTFVTDNRLYVYGDVNATAYGSQQLEGRVALMADSITLLSQHFSDRVFQRGGMDSGSPSWEDTPAIYGFDAQPTSSLPYYDGGVHGSGYAAGYAPNFCTAWRAIDGIRPRRPNADLAIYASLLMGDVPSCPGSGSSAASGDTSGGVNNFPRFVEDWRGSTRVKIKGSIVSLFRAEQGNDRFLGTSWGESPAAAAWTAGRTSSAFAYTAGETCVYTPPSRDWSFDDALENPSNLPPGTPRLVTVDRVRWMRR